MIPLLAQAAPLAPVAAPAELGWPAALVTLIGMLLPLAWSIWNTRRERIKNEILIGAIDRAADPKTKAEVKKATEARKVPSLTADVARVTKKLGGALLVASLIVLSGCHGDARVAAERYSILLRADAADVKLPREAREIAADAADFLEVQAWRLGGDAPSPELLERVEGPKAPK